jgi:hypothetical protein
MIRSLRIGVSCLLGIALLEMLQPIARALELRELRDRNPESFEPARALAAVIAAIAQDGFPLNPS